VAEGIRSVNAKLRYYGSIAMGQSRPRSYAWCDDVDSLEEQLPTDAAMAGLPEHWRHYEWKIAAILLATLWLGETWISSGPLTGMMDLNPVTEGAWGMLVALIVCAGLFPFWIRAARARALTSVS